LVTSLLGGLFLTARL